METNYQRKRALLLSLFGSIAIIGVVYLAAWLITFVISSTNQTALKVADEAGLNVAIQTTKQANPYNFNIITYVATNDKDNVEAAQFNQQIKSFVLERQNKFEEDLIFFIGTLNSPESSLVINAINLKKNDEGVEIEYQITTFIEGDSGPSSEVVSVQVLIN